MSTTDKRKSGFFEKSAGITLLFLLAFLSYTKAQVAGTTRSASYELSFLKEFNDVTLDPTPTTGDASRVQYSNTFSNTKNPAVSAVGVITDVLGAEDVDIPDWLIELTSGASFFCSGIEPVFNASASIDVGGYYQTHSIGKSKLAFDYPVKVDVVFPEKNTFGCGDKITIRTSYTLLPSPNKLLVDAPFVNQEIGVVLDNFSLNFGLGLDAHVGFGVTIYYPCWSGVCSEEICGKKKHFDFTKNFSFDPDLPDLPPLVNICDGAFGPDANESSLLACAWSQATPLLDLAQWTLDTYNEQKNTSYTIAEFPDQNMVKIAPPDLPSDVPVTFPEMEGTFKNIKTTELSYTTSNAGRNLHASGSKSSISNMSLDLISLLDYTKYITTSVSYADGKIQADIGDVSPTFTVDQHMNFDYIPEIYLTMDLGVEMDYSVYDNDGTFSHSSFGRTVNLLAGQYIEAIFPQYLSTPTTVSGSTEVKGNLVSKITQDYYRSIQLNVGNLKIDGLINLDILNTTVNKEKIDSKTILEHTEEYNLGLANLAGFLLDPENPVISISHLGVEDVRYLGSGEQAVVYKLEIANDGDVRLNDLKLDLDLNQIYSGAAYSVECLYSGDFDVNTIFDGKMDYNLFSAGNSLEVGESGTVEVLVKVRPETAAISNSGCFEPVEYEAVAKAYGVSPIGTHVENNFYQCTGERTGPDILATVDLGASEIESINDFTIYGWNLVKMDKTLGMSMGNVGAAGNITFENSSLHSNTKAIIIGDVHAGEELFIQGQTKVEANYISTAEKVKSPNWKSQLILNGALSEHSSCVRVQPVIASNYTTTGSKEKVVLGRGKIMNLSPGDYGQVILGEGAQLLLTSGEYNIDRWMFLGDDATVICKIENGPVQINLGVWQALKRRNLKFVVDGRGDADDVIYNYAGRQKCSFSASLVQGRIVAPEAEIEFSDGAVLEGSCYASTVNFKTGSSFKGLEYLKPLKINSDCQNILVPGETGTLKSGLIAQELSEQILRKDGQDRNLKVYPNPTNKNIIVSGLPEESVQIQIFNSTGQLIRQLMSNAVEMQINLEDQPQGLYYLKVKGFKSVAVTKI